MRQLSGRRGCALSRRTRQLKSRHFFFWCPSPQGARAPQTSYAGGRDDHERHPSKTECLTHAKLQRARRRRPSARHLVHPRKGTRKGRPRKQWPMRSLGGRVRLGLSALLKTTAPLWAEPSGTMQYRGDLRKVHPRCYRIANSPRGRMPEFTTPWPRPRWPRGRTGGFPSLN